MFTYKSVAVRFFLSLCSISCVYSRPSSLSKSKLAKTALSSRHTTSWASHLTTTMSTEASLKTFFSSKNFAVVGASSNTAKFGHKIFAWYLHHDIQAIPINPAAPTIAVPSLPDAAGKPSEIPTVKSLSDLPDPKETSVSIITPPPVTLKVLEEAKKLRIPAVFLQPGTFDDEVLKFARDAEGEDAGFKAVVAGFGGGTVGSEGWCVLVDGERGLKKAGKL